MVRKTFLQSARKRAGYTQAGIGALIGVTQGRYAQYERDPGSIPMYRMSALVRVLDDSEHQFRNDVNAYFFE